MATATITPGRNAVVAFVAAPPARVLQAISDPAQLRELRSASPVPIDLR